LHVVSLSRLSSIIEIILDVSGAAALLLESDPSSFGSQAREMLEAMAARNQIQNVGSGSPNNFLYIGDILGTDNSTPSAPINSNPNQSPVARPSSGYTSTVTMRLQYDDYPHETSVKLFRLVDGVYTEQESWDPPEYSGFSSAPAEDLVVTLELSNGDYSFKFYDSWGDGICCEHGTGSYSITNEDKPDRAKTGGDFESEVEVEFSV
jgi:hypothetical protein